MASLTTVNLNQLITDQRGIFECILLHSFTYSAEPFNYTILYKKNTVCFFQKLVFGGQLLEQHVMIC